MQATTGCKINVSPASGQDFQREIGLVGTRGSIEQAKRAITDKVNAVVRSNTLLVSCEFANLPQEEKNRPSGGAHRDDHYNDRYSHTTQQQQQQQQQAYGQQNAKSSQPQTGAGEVADPYAAYGGYQNYVAMWYSTLQAQQGQQQASQDQGPPGEQRPPGS